MQTVKTESNWKYIQGQIFGGKTRLALKWVAVLALPLFTKETLWWPGIVLVAVGVLLRATCAGWIRKDQELEISGPYILCRNPLYLGTFLIGIGTGVMAQSPFYTALIAAIFWITYAYIIPFEEKNLTRQFGLSYERYLETTPRFFPSFKSVLNWIQDGHKNRSFSMRLFFKNKGYEVVFAGLAILVVAFLTAKFPYKLDW